VKKITRLEAVDVPVGDLELHPHNARQGDIGAIMQSLEAHGQFRPIVVQKSRMRVIAGNHTLQAAQLVGMKTISAVLLDVDDDQALRILLADNQTGDQATNDPAILADLLEGLIHSDLGLEGTGFTGDDLDDLLVEFEPEIIIEDVKEVEPIQNLPKITKPGDVWILGRHRLICGDSTTHEAYRDLLTNEQVDLIITDPPYNVAYQGGTDDKLTIQNDNMSNKDFHDFLAASFKQMEAAMKPGAPIYVFHADAAGQPFRETFSNSGLLLKQVLVWVKQQFVLSRQDYNWQHEPILYGWKEGAAHRWYGQFNKSTVIDDDLNPEGMTKDELVEMINQIKLLSTVIREDRPNRNGEHPTMKPVRLIARLMQNSSKPRNIVLDPFGGSGSTLMAAEQLNRQARLVELDPSYCDVICNRFQGHTDIVPVLEQTGEEVSFVE
jgi:DNA modification methylase